MKKLILFFVLGLMAAFPAAAENGETAYARIMRTGTIRCGYVVYEPDLMRDPNTGAFSGIMYDVMQEIAKRLNLKIEMTTESTFGSLAEDMKTGKSDMILTSGWAYIPNARAHIVNSKPMFYSPIGVYVRKDDNRFNGKIDGLNNPSVTIAAVDGTVASTIANENFPKARVFSLPQISPYSLNLENVINGKADVTFVEVDYAERFLKKQKDKGALKNIAKDNPLRVFSVGLLIPMGELEFQQTINMAVEALLNEGFIDKLVMKYEAGPGSLLRVAKPYSG